MKEDIIKAAQALKNNKLVIFPTETVYGIGANALESDAVAKIYKAKGRPSNNPLIVHIYKIEQLKLLVSNVSQNSRKLMTKFWPGPLTLIFDKKDLIPINVTGGLDSIAIRMPSHPVALNLLQTAGVPVAAPSANISGRPSPSSFKDLDSKLIQKVEIALDGGDSPIGLESTVVDARTDQVKILRPGFITQENIETVLGLKVDLAYKSKSYSTPLSPGMMYKHYSPNAKVIIFNSVNSITEADTLGRKVGIMATTETLQKLKSTKLIKLDLGSSTRMDIVASKIFTYLNKADQLKLDILFAEEFEEKGIGAAIMDRLYRASLQ